MAAALLTVQGQSITSSREALRGVSKTLKDLEGIPSPPSSAGLYDMPRTDRATLRALNASAPILAPSLNLGGTATPFQANLPSLPVTVTKNFAGLGRGFNANWTDQFIVPPDTTMAVGPTQIVQWVNVRLTVMDKNGNPLVGGALGYVNGNAIWSGLPSGSVCRDTNQGDPLAAYDRLSNRWILSQFAFGINSSGNPAAPFAQCFAVSTSSDATGTYSLYEYQFDALPDYGKFGVWPDAYYMSYNDFTINPTTGASAFVGAKVCAYDRAAMIAGTAATQICTGRLTNRFAFLPSDLDGSTTPPPGAPNYVVSQDWFFLVVPPYSLRLQKFHVDFATPANSTFNDGIGGGNNSFIGIPLPDLLGACGDNGGACISQPGTLRVLDTLSMRPMYRLAYRNRAGVESLVLTHTVDPPSAATGSIHWMEIRSPGANPPQVYQNGAISTADGLNRWMGSAGMDNAGNLAIGYSASNGTVSPGIRIAGRYRTDVRNTLRGEANVVSGAGSQTTTAQRWGDYSTMRIDPADDCTFWYTTQYMTSTQTRDWSSRIVAFKFPNCTAPLP
jgi:hypothetical protein